MPAYLQLEERRIRDHSEKIFARLDRQGTGVVTVEQFVEACLKVGGTPQDAEYHSLTVAVPQSQSFVPCQPLPLPPALPASLPSVTRPTGAIVKIIVPLRAWEFPLRRAGWVRGADR